ncbi:MAG: hypothetical protein M1824_005965 [Vezdaea acicularis]|nr:MAG: hypothetical protein M1824_005965 [Vezdaea acicularis]
MAILLPRQYYYSNDCYYSNYNCSSNWSRWGRWVALAGILIFFFLLFFICASITNRRRRRRGMQPYRGTGWVPYSGAQPATGYANQHQQTPYYGNTQPTAPVGQDPQYNHHNENAGYYGGQQNGVELQSPYGAGQEGPPQYGGYAPPTGPPPVHQKDGIIR